MKKLYEVFVEKLTIVAVYAESEKEAREAAGKAVDSWEEITVCVPHDDQKEILLRDAGIEKLP